MATYQGHKNWNHWNVALWIMNDEGLYRAACRCERSATTKDNAARRFLQELDEAGITKTPDGAPYSFSSVRAAISDL